MLELARASRCRAGDGELEALALNYLGIAAVERGDAGGLQLVRDSVTAALDGAPPRGRRPRLLQRRRAAVPRGRARTSWRRWIAEGLPFARERGFWSHAYNLEVHRCVVLLRRGELDGGASRAAPARRGRRRTPACCSPTACRGWAARWRARATRPRAGCWPRAWERARRQRLLLGVAYAGLARAEWAWLTGRADVARSVGELLAPRLAHPGAAPFRAELRAGWRAAGSSPPQPSTLPAPWALGLRGDHPAAATAWAAAGDPYEQALELAEAGERGARRPRPCGRSTRMGADGAAARVRAGLRAAGVWPRAGRARPRAPTPPASRAASSTSSSSSARA